MASDVLNIGNGSLQLGLFPKALKTTGIKPLLMKSNLEASVISNYSPILNLHFLGKTFFVQNDVFNAFQCYFDPTTPPRLHSLMSLLTLFLVSNVFAIPL